MSIQIPETMGNVYQSDQTFVTVEISTTGKISRLPLFVRMGSFILSTAASLKDIFSLWMYAHIRGGVCVCVCARVLTHAGVSRYQRSVPGITSMTLYYYIEAESLTEPRSHIFFSYQHSSLSKLSCLSVHTSAGVPGIPRTAGTTSGCSVSASIQTRIFVFA